MTMMTGDDDSYRIIAVVCLLLFCVVHCVASLSLSIVVLCCLF